MRSPRSKRTSFFWTRNSPDAAHVVRVNTPISLAPGANTVVAVDQLTVGFGWKTVAGKGPAAELVPAAILCDMAGRAVDADSLVFFNQLTTSTAGGAVQYISGGDQEQIDIDLPSVPATVSRILLVLFVNPDERSPGSFDAVRDAYVRLITDGVEHARFEMPRPEQTTISASNFGELYRHRGGWKFRALGDGYRGGIADVSRAVGIRL
jgi:tellurium resistance protein TerD